MPVPPVRPGVITVGTEWNRFNRSGLDLDLAAIALMANGQAPSPAYFVFFNNKQSARGEILHSGGEGDDSAEYLTIDTTALPGGITKVAVCVTVYGAEGTFRMLSDAHIWVSDSTSAVLANFNLTADSPVATTLVYAELVRDADRWRFVATGETYADLRAVATAYGINVG